MRSKILFCWIGATDLKAAGGQSDAGLGPIGQAVAERSYGKVVLLNNYDKDTAEKYIGWLHQKTSSDIKLHQISLSGPTNFGEIYTAASSAVAKELSGYDLKAEPVFHLSPGTPAMAAVWILLAKTKFPAMLIESSMAHGVQTASVPFDISVDLIPDLLKKSDDVLWRLSAGLPASAPEFDDIYHRSEIMQKAVLKARRLAPRSIPVLIEGESGTGKELFARAIHDASPRRMKPFVAINCGAIPPDLVEAELFGHEKGTFTGAIAKRIGLFEAANQGTIFLDEIGELPKNMQVKILRTLQENEIRRIGATTTQKIDIRIITATNRNLIEEVASGSFREDLFYRLAVAVIKIPSLSERIGDISLLVDKFLQEINLEYFNDIGFKKKKISATARNLLLQHPWPGNVRELKNTLTRAAVLSIEEEIGDHDIDEALFPVSSAGYGRKGILNQPIENGINLPEIMKAVAVHYLKRGLEFSKGNKTQAAKILGLPSYQTLTNWLRKYGLE